MTYSTKALEIFLNKVQISSETYFINEKDGSILVQVPAGYFEMGVEEPEIDDVLFTPVPEDSNPLSGVYHPPDNVQHRVYLDSFYIGVFAITNRQYKRFVHETGHRPPARPNWGKPVWEGNSCPEDKAEHPVVCISWMSAQKYCQWAGLLLPTEAQWEKSARGPLEYLHPWGNEWHDKRCRHYYNRGSETTCPVYGYSSGVSGYGTFNQLGNVLEWCWDWYDDMYYSTDMKPNPAGPPSGQHRVIRGGSWYESQFQATCRFLRHPGAPQQLIGFRVASVR